MEPDPEVACSIERALGVLGERWTLLVLREAGLGATKFAEFRERLGIAPDVLSSRLGTLVQNGVLDRVPYREAGSRTRFAYELTPSGRELRVVFGALQQWGDRHLPRAAGPSMVRRDRETGLPLHVGFIDQRGQQVALGAVTMLPPESIAT